jgi:integrating conjugative element protein (TIGR03755 family)
MNKIIITTIATFITTSTVAETTIDETQFLNANSKLYYEIGGAKRFNRPIYNTNYDNINLGVGTDVNLGYSCGNFDYKASFANTMNNLKNNVDSVKNSIIGNIQSGISALPMTIYARAKPTDFNVFQDYSAKIDADIQLANKSCEQMEAEIMAGGNPYANFLQGSKAQAWKDKAQSGDDIIAANKDIEKSVGEAGITSFGGKKVGGLKQAPLKVISDSVGAGYNFLIGESDPLAETTASEDNQMHYYFKTRADAQQFATDVIGEFEINNANPKTKIGTGLHSKVELERQQVEQHIVNNEWQKAGIDPNTQRKIEAFDLADQAIILGNYIDDMAIKNTIRKALIIRKILIAGEQDPNESATGNEVSTIVRDKKIALLDKEIESLMFERKINQELANSTLVKVLDLPQVKTKYKPQPKENKFF